MEQNSETRNTESQRKILFWCRMGFVFLAIAGSLIHFIYPLSGRSVWVAWFAPVNESVWEHFKLGYWAMVLFTIIEFPYLRTHANNYFLAKSTGILALTLTIPVVYYSYFSFTQRNFLVIDISSYFLGAVICQWLVYRICLKKNLGKMLNFSGLLAFIAIGIILIFFTWAPPQKPIFKDRKQQSYGIPSGALRQP